MLVSCKGDFRWPHSDYGGRQFRCGKPRVVKRRPPAACNASYYRLVCSAENIRFKGGIRLFPSGGSSRKPAVPGDLESVDLPMAAKVLILQPDRNHRRLRRFLFRGSICRFPLFKMVSTCRSHDACPDFQNLLIGQGRCVHFLKLVHRVRCCSPRCS